MLVKELTSKCLEKGYLRSKERRKHDKNSKRAYGSFDRIYIQAYLSIFLNYYCYFPFNFCACTINFHYTCKKNLKKSNDLAKFFLV